MMARTTREEAVTFLRSYVRSHGIGNGAFLPGVRHLKELSGISHVTLLRTMRELAERGELAIEPGRGVRVVGGLITGDRGGDATPRRHWELVARRLRNDIAIGALERSGPFPSMTELCSHYHVNYRTMRKILIRLCDEGHLEPHHRHYRIPLPPAVAGSLFIEAYIRGRRFEDYSNMPERTHLLVRELEHQCEIRRVGLTVTLLDQEAGRIFRISGQHGGKQGVPATTSRCAAFLFLIGFSPGEELFGYMRTLAARQEPLVIVDETGAEHMTEHMRQYPAVTTVSLAQGPGCGYDVGRALVRRGIQRVAFLYQEPLQGWSQRRLSGLQRAFAESGFDDAAVPVAVHHPRPPFAVEQLRAAGEPLSPSWQRALENALDRHRIVLGQTIRSAHDREGLGELLTSILASHRPQALVAEHDPLALACKDALDFEGPVPIPIIGFDNSLEATFRSLSSYHFDLRSLAQEMVAAALRPVRPRVPLSKRIVEAQGTLIWRDG